MDSKPGPSEPPYFVVDLGAVRRCLIAPTWLAERLTEATGAELIAVRPGQIQAILPSGAPVTITIRATNVFRGEAQAYRRAGMPVPPHVLEDIKRWDREHGLLHNEKEPADD